MSVYFDWHSAVSRALKRAEYWRNLSHSPGLSQSRRRFQRESMRWWALYALRCRASARGLAQSFIQSPSGITEGGIVEGAR